MFFVSSLLWGGGKKEDQLPLAQQLVQEKKYSEAITVLADIVKNEPERLDQVEALMAEIRNARNLYNNNYSDLITLLKKETLTDSDITQAYNLITEMEKIDAAPDQAITGSFEKARRTIVFRYNDNQFKDIMDRALVLIDAGQYWEAVSLYLQAVGLHGELFREDYPEEIIAEVDSVIEKIYSDYKSIISLKDRFVVLKDNSLVSSRKEYYDNLLSEYSGLMNIISDMGIIRTNSVKNAGFFDDERNKLLKEGEYDIPFLSTINRTIMGRASSEREEGLVFAIESIWNSALNENLLLLEEKQSLYFNEGIADFDSSLYQDASAAFRKSQGVSDIRKDLLSMWGYSVNPQKDYNLSSRDLNKIKTFVPEYILAEKQSKAASDYASLSEIMDEISVIEKNYSLADSPDILIRYRGNIVRDRSVVSLNREVWNEIYQSNSMISGDRFRMEDTLKLSSSMEELFQRYSSHLSDLELDIIRSRFDLVYNPLRNNLDLEEEKISNAALLVDGIEETVGEGDTAYTGILKYPEKAIPVLESSSDNLEKYDAEYLELLRLFEGEDLNITGSAVASESTGKIESDRGKISDLKNKIGLYRIKTNELMTQAEIYSTQGYKRLDEAKVRLRQNRFTESRERLQEARESFRISLSYNEDPELRSFTDREILSLSDEIIRLQTALVIETVRKNLNKAREFYTKEKFGDAENLLINSQTMWKTVNTEDNEEVQYWLNLVQTALSIRSGRVIAETDPLYNEMTQVINLARNDYITARNMIKEGRKGEAMQYLDKAQEKLLYVSIPFPMNQEASILSLEILKLKDTDNFEQLFREKYNLARERININPSESYILLKDLAEINPEYPGIKKAIYDTEIKLGMRTPPPDPAKIREAEELYRKAYAIVSSNVRSNYPTALAYLNSAFTLNPDNTRITELKDRVQTEMGGTTTVVLSSYAQEQYRQAEQEFINGNYYASLSIVNKLLQDRKNRNYTPLLELKRRIDSKI